MAQSILVIGPSLAGALVWAAGAASAEDIAGRWTFKTDALASNGCVISGEITVRPAARTSAPVCELVTREDCTTGGTATYQKVKQSCTVAIKNGEIAIDSKVEAVLDAGPPSLRAKLMSRAYAPDNFRLRRRGRDDLLGFFFSIQKAGVRFLRDVDRIS